jgi:hypothetical protein
MNAGSSDDRCAACGPSGSSGAHKAGKAALTCGSPIVDILIGEPRGGTFLGVDIKLITESSDRAGLWRFLPLSTARPPSEVIVAAAARELQTKPRDVTAFRRRAVADRAAENARAAQRASLRDRVRWVRYSVEQLMEDRTARGLDGMSRPRPLDGAGASLAS